MIDDKKIKCPKCGIELPKVALYSCPKLDCPIQVKVVL